MRLGVFARTFPGTDPTAVLGAARDAGFASVQFNMACAGLPSLPEDVPDAALQAIGDAKRETGVVIAALSATWNMAHPDSAVRTAGLRSAEALAAAAAALGIPVLTLCTGSRNVADQWAHHPDNASPDAWRDMMTGMVAALAVAERHGLRLGVEPEPGNVVSGPRRARALLDALRSPRIGIVLDPANLLDGPTTEGERRRAVEEAIDLLGPNLVLAHAKDRTPEGAVAAPGRGAIDWPHVLGRLRSAGFHGDLVAHGFEAEEAPGVARHLSALMAAA